ncbi:MAG: hypothetical protein PSX36_08175 [bacterium]|nr:hypothetical protein [bacterium]
MYKQHLLLSLEKEINLLKQLAPLIEERDFDYRPAEKVRSTRELMQYLSNIGSNMMRWFVLNDLTKEEWVKIREYRSTLTLANFTERLDKQMEDIKMYMEQITDDDLFSKEVELPNKDKMPLGMAIINAPIKWLTAYRMELFLYLKMNGRSEISTREAWSVQSS